MTPIIAIPILLLAQSKLLVTSQDFIEYETMKERTRRTAVDWERWFSDNPDWRAYADLACFPPLPEEIMTEFHDASPEVLSRCREMVTEGGGWVSRGAIYVRVRREGEERGNNADRWACMLALNAFPGINTTDSFWAGRKPWHEVFGERYANRVKSELARKGVNITAGQEYMPELARYVGDPEAVVPFNGARSYMKKLCEKRGWAINGATTVDHREPDSDPYESAPPLAEDIIREKGRQMVQKGQFKGKDRKALREAVIERFGRSKAPKKHLKDLP